MSAHTPEYTAAYIKELEQANDAFKAINAELLEMLRRVTATGENWMDDACGRINSPVFIESRALIDKVRNMK